MNWREFWLEHAIDTDDPHKQVLRTVGGKPVDDGVITAIAKSIVNGACIKPDDAVLDLCSGNGVLTRELAKHCGSIVGVDFAFLPDPGENYHFVRADVREYEPHKNFDKIIIYAGIQYFSYEDTVSLIMHTLRFLWQDGVIFIGDVPNLCDIWHFFDTDTRRKLYFAGLCLGTPIVGTWFDPYWMMNLLLACGYVDPFVLNQPAPLPYRSWRFDVRASV